MQALRESDEIVRNDGAESFLKLDSVPFLLRPISSPHKICEQLERLVFFLDKTLDQKIGLALANQVKFVAGNAYGIRCLCGHPYYCWCDNRGD